MGREEIRRGDGTRREDKGGGAVMIELKPHRWDEGEKHHRADFFPFVDGIPRHDLANCDQCVFGKTIQDGTCDKGREVGDKKDSRLYLFCGPICGYFEMEVGVR